MNQAHYDKYVKLFHTNEIVLLRAKIFAQDIKDLCDFEDYLSFHVFTRINPPSDEEEKFMFEYSEQFFNKIKEF